MVETFFLETLRGLSQSAANYTFAQDYSPLCTPVHLICSSWSNP